MNIKLIIIDEPIKINDSSFDTTLSLWRRSLWAKFASYGLHYKNSCFTLGADDFFGSHLIVANELENGELEPVIMFKTVQLSKYKKYNVEFSLMKTLKETPFKDSLIINRMIKSEQNISYHTSFTLNPKYINHPERKHFKEYISILCCAYNIHFNVKQWVAIAAKKYKVDKFFEGNGAQKIHDEFCVEASDYEPVQLFHHPNTDLIPEAIAKLMTKHENLINNINIFTPNGKEQYNNNKIPNKKTA